MAAVRLFRRHDAASQAKYQEAKQLARAQARVLSGTPGTLKRRTQAGNRYWVREHIRVDGRKVDEYLGPERTLDEARVAELREALELARALAAASAQLRLLGYQRIDRKPAAVLEVLFNRGLTGAGLTLVGSHAYGALLNELGVIAPGYYRRNVDRALATEVLVPVRETGRAALVKELGAHAQSIPLLDYLIDDPIDGVILSPNQVIPVKLPAPERFVLHKLYASQSRRADRGKSRKDLEQAAVLTAALEEEAPGSLPGAFKSFPQKGRPAARRAARAAASLLDGVHEEAREALLEIAGA